MASSRNFPEENPERDRSVRPPESKWRSLVQNMADIVVVIDAEAIVRFANPQMEKALGLRNESVVGRSIFDFIHPDDIQRTQAEFSQTIRNPGEGVPSLLRVREAAGGWIPFEIIANNRLDDPKVQGVIFTARDLRHRREIEKTIERTNADVERRVEERTTGLAKANTALRLENQARRQTEAQLQATVSLLNATLDSTCDGILVISRDGKIASHNQRFLDMWGIGAESHIGEDDESLLVLAADQFEDDEFVNKVRALYSDPTATSFDVLHLKDGRIFERYSQPQRIAERIVGRVWSFRDVTQAKRLEEELRQAQKMEAIGRLAGGISHDFNNLLMLILGYVSRLSESTLSSEQRDTCEELVAVTKRAAALTGQLLTFSRKHEGSPTINDLNQIVSNMDGMLHSLVSSCIRFHVSLSADPLPVLADVSRVELLIMNLAINARDAMNEGGQLSIATRRQELPAGTPTAKGNSSAYAVLSVSDTGRGMSPEVRAHIFEPFFTTKEAGKGTGLGLSIVSAIAERIGGHIEVQSEPDRGTRFDVYLPLAVAAPGRSAAAPSLPPPARGDETILIAEDEAGIRTMTAAYLEGLGYRVLEAADGTEAVKVAAEHQGAIHLVLADLLMPGMRGDSVVGAIRRHRPDVKALFISGYADEDLETNGAAVLQKPFEFPELGRQVRSLLDSGLAAAS